MADHVELNAGSGGAVLATDEIAGTHHQRVKIQHGADGSATDVSSNSGLPVVEALVDPKLTYASDTSIAAGGATNLESAQVSSGKTGKLLSVVFGASIALKAELQTVLNGVGTTRMVLFSLAGQDRIFQSPSKEFITQTESVTAGLDGFRLVITNLDTSQSADVYGTFLFDETD